MPRPRAHAPASRTRSSSRDEGAEQNAKQRQKRKRTRSSSNADTDQQAAKINVGQMKVVELRAALKERGLDTKGLKKALVKRLENALA